MSNEEAVKKEPAALEGFQTIKENIENPNIQNLLKKAHLTKRQLEALLIWREMKREGKKFKNKNKVIMTEKDVSKGSFYRVLKQARSNIRKSILTIIILYLFELLDEKNLIMLNKVINAILNADKETKMEIINNIDSLLVM